MSGPHQTVARLIVACLENEGVGYVFGLPGEENLHTIDALADSSIRFITTRDERGAAFMADTYGALTGKAGVCLATLGPGAINLMLGIANAQLDSHPLVAIMAQAGLHRLYKESHQFVDLVSLFRPITKWGDMVTCPTAAPEMMRKAFKQAHDRAAGRDVPRPSRGRRRTPDRRAATARQHPGRPAPDKNQVQRAATCCRGAITRRAGGPGVARDGATDALIRFRERLNMPVATTFLGKGVFPDNHPNALGTVGFMVRTTRTSGSIGPTWWWRSATTWSSTRRPMEPPARQADRPRAPTVAEVDANYTLAVGVQGNIGETLDAIGGRHLHDAPGGDPRGASSCGKSSSGAPPTSVPAGAAASCTTSGRSSRRRHRPV